MDEVTLSALQVCLIIVGVSAIVLLAAIVIRQILKGSKKQDAEQNIQQNIRPPVDSRIAEQEKLRAAYMESRAELRRVKALQNYAKLFTNITPLIQMLLGYNRYELKNDSTEQVCRNLNYLVGDNLETAAYNAGFELTADGHLKDIRRNVKPEPEDRVIPEPDKLAAAMAETKSAIRQFMEYNVMRRACEGSAKSIVMLNEMLKSGAPLSNAVSNEVAKITEAYHAEGIEFKFYEDFSNQGADIKGFAVGEDGQRLYPAVFRNGQIYCNLIGRRG